MTIPDDTAAAAAAAAAPRPGDWIPRPDPTLLTTAQLLREVSSLRAILEARMDSMDSERDLLRRLMDERSAEVQRRFEERDVRFDERDESRQAAQRLALDSAQALVNERDRATTKATEKFEEAVRLQISQLAELAAANRELLDGRINDLKERIDRGEGTDRGIDKTRGSVTSNVMVLVMSASMLIALISVIAFVLKK